MVPVMVTTVEIVRFRLSAAPTKRTRPSCFGLAQPRCPRPKSFEAVSSMLMMQEGCTPYSRHVEHQVVFLCPPDAARYLKRAQRRKWRIHLSLNLRVMPCCSATRLKMGLHHRRGNQDALLSQNGNDRYASISRFAAFLLVLVQPSSQCPHREPRLEDIRQPCRQVVRDYPVVPRPLARALCCDRRGCASSSSSPNTSTDLCPAPRSSTRERGGGLWARPPVLSLVLLQANHNPHQPSKNTGQKLLNNKHGVQK